MKNNIVTESTLEAECIEDVIKTYENDICCGLNDQPEFNEIRIAFAEIIIYMVRNAMDIQYCDNDKCCCSAISNMSHHFKRNRDIFEKYMSNNVFHLLDAISKQFIETTE